MNKRLSLSLVALVGSVILFIVTSLAWFSVSEWVNIDFFQGSVNDYNINYTIYESSDGFNYNEMTAFSFELASPGDKKYYRIDITNPEDTDYQMDVIFSGINDVYSDGSPSSEPVSIMEVVQLKTTINGQIVVNGRMDDLLSNDIIEITGNFELAANDSVSVFFSLEIIGNEANNQYQNLGLDIDEIKVFYNVE
jgi:hypothetical protein